LRLLVMEGRELVNLGSFFSLLVLLVCNKFVILGLKVVPNALVEDCDLLTERDVWNGSLKRLSCGNKRPSTRVHLHLCTSKLQSDRAE
jgi:hypothetical protein